MNKRLKYDGRTDDGGKDRSLFAIIAVVAGFVGLLSDCLQWPHFKVLNVHLLFGFALLAAVARALAGNWHSRTRGCAGHCVLFAQHLARRVYLLLYVMAAVRLGIFAIEAARAPTWTATFHYLGSGNSLQDFLVYIGYGACAVCVIRLCAFARGPQDIQRSQMQS